jgi:endonuclease-8
MPEGPSIVLAAEAMKKFTGRKVLDVTGNTTTIDKQQLQNKKVLAIKSWGKHLLICFNHFTVRIHFMLFGSNSIDEKKDKLVRLGLKFTNGDLYFYTCSVKMLEEDLDTIYDWSADVMNENWNEKAAVKKLRAVPDMLICDALLEQEIFSGVGNIIKNEILFRVRVHPESKSGSIPRAKLNRLVKEARIYSFQFLEWKRAFILKKQWLAHTKTICANCGSKLIKKHTGIKKRRSFFCTTCQKLYS